MGSKNPQFGHIHIISEDNTVYFLLKKLTNVNFNTHFHAYEINFTEDWCYLKLQDLAVHIRITINSKQLVSFRFVFY